MCRNIQTLYNYEPPATEEEVRAAALQFVRKISGFHKPSMANEEPFYAAVDEVARISAQLLAALETRAAPRSRQEPAGRWRKTAARQHERPPGAAEA